MSGLCSQGLQLLSNGAWVLQLSEMAAMLSAENTRLEVGDGCPKGGKVDLGHDSSGCGGSQTRETGLPTPCNVSPGEPERNSLISIP
jgi:hypothetical protein